MTHNEIEQYLSDKELNTFEYQLAMDAMLFAEQKTIERTCEWLENNVNNYIIIDDYLGKVQPKISSNMFDNLKKAMEL